MTRETCRASSFVSPTAISSRPVIVTWLSPMLPGGNELKASLVEQRLQALLDQPLRRHGQSFGGERLIAAFDAEFVRWTKENEDARRLATIPGVGATIASALIAAIGKGETFERGRDLAAWLGLVPRQFTTGGKPKLLAACRTRVLARAILAS